VAISRQFIGCRKSFQRSTRQSSVTPERMRLPPQHPGPDVMSTPEKPETKMKRALQSPEKSIVLVGLMGAGKTSIGKRLAKKLGMPFVDADVEIEAAADCSIEEIFTRYGEQAFRDGERRVIARLLDDAPCVVATGGGAFVSAETRENVRRAGISVWLKADVEVLLQRVSRRNNRPLLKGGDKRATLERLVAERYPTYEEADCTVESGNESPDVTVNRVLDALRARDSETLPQHQSSDTAAG